MHQYDKKEKLEISISTSEVFIDTDNRHINLHSCYRRWLARIKSMKMNNEPLRFNNLDTHLESMWVMYQSKYQTCLVLLSHARYKKLESLAYRSFGYHISKEENKSKGDNKRDFIWAFGSSSFNLDQYKLASYLNIYV